MPYKDKQKTNEYMRQWRKKHPGYTSKYVIAWKKKHPGYDVPYIIAWQKNNPDKHKAIRRKYRKKVEAELKNNPIALLKYKARKTLRNAVASGKIKRLPCETCFEVKVEGHHEDYNRPLEVRWLCILHHNQAHGNCLSLSPASSEENN